MLALASGAQMLSIDSDLGRHLTLGNYILDHRIVPTRDLFSHTLLGHPDLPTSGFHKSCLRFPIVC
jgi:hypothetical protein